GHSVHFVSYRLPFRLDEPTGNIAFHEVDVSTYSLFEYPPHELALAAKMAEVSRENRLDVLHVHYAIPHAITGFLAQQMLGKDAPRLVTTLHGTDITLVGQDRSFFEITRFGILRSDGVSAVSEFLRRMTAEEFDIKNRIEVIPNFVDLSLYDRRSVPDRSAFAPGGDGGGSAGRGIGCRRAPRGRAPRRDRLSPAGRRHRGDGREDHRDPEGRRAPALPRPGRARPRRLALQSRPHRHPVRAALRTRARPGMTLPFNAEDGERRRGRREHMNLRIP